MEISSNLKSQQKTIHEKYQNIFFVASRRPQFLASLLQTEDSSFLIFSICENVFPVNTMMMWKLTTHDVAIVNKIIKCQVNLKKWLVAWMSEWEIVWCRNGMKCWKICLRNGNVVQCHQNSTCNFLECIVAWNVNNNYQISTIFQFIFTIDFDLLMTYFV